MLLFRDALLKRSSRVREKWTLTPLVRQQSFHSRPTPATCSRTHTLFIDAAVDRRKQEHSMSQAAESASSSVNRRMESNSLKRNRKAFD